MSKKLTREGHSIQSKEIIELLDNKSSHNKPRHMYLFNPHDIVVIESDNKRHKWICEYKSYVNDQLHFYKGTYDIYSNEKEYKGKVIYNSFYDVAPSDIIRAASPDEIALLKRMMEKNNTTNRMPNVLAELLDHIKNTSKEELENEFNELKEWSHVGPTVDEFMDFCNKVTKKPEYPKTYKECCEVLEFCGDYFLTTYDADSMDTKEVYGILQQVNSLTRLLICKLAYWKIAGEEMGLDRPWEPKFGKTVLFDITFYLYQDNFVLHKGEYRSSDNCILVFPTEEMRDAFHANFKELIEQCKELL